MMSGQFGAYEIEVSEHAIIRLYERFPQIRGIRSRNRLIDLIIESVRGSVVLGPSVRGRKIIAARVIHDLTCYFVMEPAARRWCVVTTLSKEMAEQHMVDVRRRQQQRFLNRIPEKGHKIRGRRPPRRRGRIDWKGDEE